MRDYIRAKSFALSIVVNLLLVLVVALFIVPKIIMDREEEQFYVVDLQSDWSPDSEGGHSGGGGGGNLFPDKLSEADMAKRVNQVVQSQSVFAQPVENAGEDSVNVPAASSEGDRDMSSSTTGGGVSGNGPGTGGGSGGGGEAPRAPFDYEGFRAAVEANKSYPPMLMKRNIEGTATIGATILPDGTVTDVVVLGASDGQFGSAAAAAARAVGHYPNPTGETVETQTTVRFEITDGE